MESQANDGKPGKFIGEISKAKRYAQEPERIQFSRFEATFRGERDVHTTTYNNGEWRCTCRFFHEWGDCSHTMAMQRILGVTIPKAQRFDIVKNNQEPEPVQEEIWAPDIQSIRIRIIENPLTPHNLATILSAITDLYTKCWLIVQRRVVDLLRFEQTHDIRFIEEAHLSISKITYNSPLNIDCKVDASPQGLMIALTTGIDAISQAPHRVESIVLDNKMKELSYKVKELEAQSELADKEQARQLAAEKAELEKQAALLEMEQKRLDVMAKRLEVEKTRIDYAFEIAGKMVNTLRPNADEETKLLLMQTLLPTLLQLGMGIGLELALPIAQSNKGNEPPTQEPTP